MILFLIPDSRIFLQAKAYVSKDSLKQDGFSVVEFKLSGNTWKNHGSLSKYSLISKKLLLQPPLLKAAK